MLIRNDTPFAAQGFGDLHRDGMRMAVICTRATYHLTAHGALRLANDQKVALADVYEGDPLRTPLVRTGDLIAYKPAADVTLVGTAYAPQGQPAPIWEVAIEIGDRRIGLRVSGPRQWVPTLRRLKPSWKLGLAEPVASVPLDYRLASGGRFAGDPDGAVDDRNPIGPGVLHADWTPVGKALRAPQIDSVREPISDPFAAPEPQGFGPVPPFWRWRESHLGTRDEAWQRERCPQMPEDLSYRFFQTAHPDLILPRLVGDERVRLEGLFPGGRSLAFSLPGTALVAHHIWSDGRAVDARLTLDGLHLDLREPEGHWTADLTWRGWVARCPAYRGATVEAVRTGEPADLPISGEHGLTEPQMAKASA